MAGKISMMRTISGLAGFALLISIAFAPENVLGISVVIIAMIGLCEFYNAVSIAGYKPVRLIGYFSGIYLLEIALSNIFGNSGKLATIANVIEVGNLSIYLILAILLSIIVFKSTKYNITDISMTLFGIIYVVYLFSFIILTRYMIDGFYYIWFVFVGAWATDTCAYLFGVTLGKHKSVFAVSPNKTAEGAIGGIIGCIALTVALGLFFTKSGYIANIPFYHFIILGLICGVIAQLGDLSASSIKRFVKIKDYGKLMPGHGGVLDRFDSILFIAPFVYFYINSFMI